MKKAFFLISLSLSFVTNLGYAQNSEYYKKGIEVLKREKYQSVKIKGQLQGYCTISKKDFDFNAAIFNAIDENQNIVDGVVCGEKIYIHSISHK